MKKPKNICSCSEVGEVNFQRHNDIVTAYCRACGGALARTPDSCSPKARVEIFHKSTPSPERFAVVLLEEVQKKIR